MAGTPKPARSVWLIAKRKAREESVEDVARLVSRDPLTVRGWEAGRPPKRADDPSFAILERHYDSAAPTNGEQAARADYAAIIQAIDRQTDMLERVLIALGGQALDVPLDEELHRQRDATRPLVPTGDHLPGTAE